MQRFRYESYNESLKNVHLPLVKPEEDSEHFRTALEDWRQLNLSRSFTQFAHRAAPLAQSIPLLLHNWNQVFELWLEAVNSADDEGLKALLDLFQKLLQDLHTTLLPVYPAILDCLLSLLARAISPEALTALLSTFAITFKYLLSEGQLGETWAAIHRLLPRCLPEIQRSFAEVYASVLRRFKNAVRAKAVVLMVQELKDVEDTVAWILVFACKSVSQTLHTCTPSIFSPVLSHYLSCSDPLPMYTLLRRYLLALIHHVKNAEQFSPISQILVDQFTLSTDDQNESLLRLFQVLAVVCSARQGSRLTADLIQSVLTRTVTISPSDNLNKPLVAVITACLTASEMPIWLSTGRTLLENAWSSPLFAISLYGALADISWGGWKMIAVPLLLKKTPEMLGKEPRRMMTLLAFCAGNLGQVDVVWREKVNKWVCAQLRDWDRSEEELKDILSLSPYFSAEVTPVLIQLVEQFAADDRPPTGVHLLLRTLSTRPATELSKVNLPSLLQRLLVKFPSNADVLESVVLFADRAMNEKIPLQEAYSILNSNLLSHQRKLRLQTLRILASSLVENAPEASEGIKKCLAAEEISLDVQGVRERVLLTGKAGQAPSSCGDIARDVRVSWLTAQLKVNLQPLRRPAALALAEMVQSGHGDHVWKLVFGEVQDSFTAKVKESVRNGEEDEKSEEKDNKVDDPWEAERSWRDPSAHKVAEVAAKWTSFHFPAHEDDRERYDPTSYHLQLVMALQESSALAEKHNRELVPFFLAGVTDGTLGRQRLSAYLTLFSQFTNPKALYSTEQLHSLYMSLLSHLDRSIRVLALKCLFTYKPASLMRYEDQLSALLDETRWRDELATLVSQLESNTQVGRNDLLDVLIRLLFGIMLDRKVKKRGYDRRAAVLSALAGCSETELGVLIDLMLEPLQQQHSDELAKAKHQLGFLTLLGDVLRILGTKVVTYWPKLLDTVLSMTAAAHSLTRGIPDAAEKEEDDEEEDENPAQEASGSSRTTRTIRSLGVKRLTDFFKSPVSFDFAPYVSTAFRTFISSRVQSLPADNTNTLHPSALLELFHTWSSDGDRVRYLVDYDEGVLPSVYNCLIGNIRPPVANRVLDIIEQILSFAETDETITTHVLRPHITHLLNQLTTLVGRTKKMSGSELSSPLVQRQINVLSRLAPHAHDSAQAQMLLDLLTTLLQRPNKIVPEKMKADVLSVFVHLLPLVNEISDPSSSTSEKVYSLLSQMFQSLRSRHSRTTLLATFTALSEIDVSLQRIVDIIKDLNAFSVRRVDEPDFEARLRAYELVNTELHQSLSMREWLPLLYNMLHFLQDANELAIRSNASQTLKRFVDLVASKPNAEYQEMFSKTLFPGLKNGLRSRHELVRSEILGVISYSVSQTSSIGTLQDMKILLANGDEEANFFNNIQHVQLHRRTRALRRLADLCDEQPLKQTTLTDIILPLISNYITSTSSTDHHLVNEAVTCTGRLCKHLSWGAYNSQVKRYLQLARAKDETERVYVRALVAVLENFPFAMEATADTAGDDDQEDEESGEQAAPQQSSSMAEVVNKRLLPTLLEFVELRDSTSEETARIPLAVGIVTVANHLPESTGRPHITRLLTILSQIFRSKSQDMRDTTREVLTKITLLLGPKYLPTVFSELRAALTRGPQIHVLTFLTHAVLVHVTNEGHSATFHTLDDSVADVAHVAAEAVFGESAKDVDAEDFKTKMREVRGSRSKGLDSFGIMARYITPEKISSLLLPLRSIMQETVTLKTMQLVEEVLRRIATGLNSNTHLVPAELISLCHTLITQNSRFLQEAPIQRKKAMKGDAVVQTKRNAETEQDHYSTNSFRFVAFGLDLFHTALRRSRFDFHDSAILSRLESMVVAVGNTLYSNNSPVIVLAVKCVSSLVKCPLKSLEKSLPVFVRQILQIIKSAGNTEAEVVQASLKSLAMVLRDGPKAVQVKEPDLVYLLELIGPDLEEPERQASVFMMLRAIVGRKFVVPEIYDLMQKVSEVMVTSQSPQVQELCRGVLLQFLLDYPQGKGRLKHQMAFLAKNLSYVHESGRRSVMELLSAVLEKFQEELVLEYSDLFFVALVMVIANDESPKCKEMASALITVLLAKQNEEQQGKIVERLHVWATQDAKPDLKRVSFQICGLFVDALGASSTSFLSRMVTDVNNALRESGEELKSAQNSGTDAMEVDLDWQIPYHSLIFLSKMFRVFPDRLTGSGVDWTLVVQHLVFPHTWVRTASCRLLGVLFGSSASALTMLSLKDVSTKLCTQLRSEHLEEALSTQIIKNLLYIGKHVEEEEVAWLFSKISYQLRSSHIARRNKGTASRHWSRQPTSILRWFAAMASHLSDEQLRKYLVHILTPIYRILEDDTVHDDEMKELKILATEVQGHVQAKVGTSEFAVVYSQIRQGAAEVRRERKANLAVKIATNPEAAEKRKNQKRLLKKESKKRKNELFADGRGRKKMRVD